MVARTSRVTFSLANFSSSHHQPHVLQDGHCHHATKQQQGEDVWVQQQSTSQALQCVKRQQAKGLLTQVKTGIEIPDRGVNNGKNTKDKESSKTFQLYLFCLEFFQFRYSNRSRMDVNVMCSTITQIAINVNAH